jgi:hypothetical protein
MRKTMTVRLLTFIAALTPTVLFAHGFSLRNVGNAILAENNDPPYWNAHVFGHPLDIANVQLNRNQTDHGSIDADTPGSGFTIPGDVLQMELLGQLWYSNGLGAAAAAPGVVLTATQKVTNATSTISSTGPVGGLFTLAAASAHEMIWSLPLNAPEGAYGVSYRIKGNSAGGQPFVASDPLVLVLTTPGFTADPLAAEQAIYASAVPEPTTLGLIGAAGLVLFLGRGRIKRLCNRRMSFGIPPLDVRCQNTLG